MIKKDGPLINVDSLREQIIKNSVRIIDVRRTEDYQQGHITNSVNLPLAKLLADASPENIVKIAEELGIGNETPVVVYDDTFGALSSRVVWALQYIGHENVKLLDVSKGLPTDLTVNDAKTVLPLPPTIALVICTLSPTSYPVPLLIIKRF